MSDLSGIKFEGFIEIEKGLWYCEKDGTPYSNKCLNGRGYLNYLRKLYCKRKNYYLVSGKKSKIWSKLVYEYFKGPIPQGYEIDHKNNIRDDNRIENLQLLNHSYNTKKRKKQNDNKTGYAGVYWCKTWKKYKTQISINNSGQMYLGSFDDPEQAFICYLENKIHYHGWDSILPLI